MRTHLLVVALAALLVAACGDSDKKASTGGQRATLGPTVAARAESPAATAVQNATPAARGNPSIRRQPAPFDPASFQLTLETVGQGFSRPTYVTNAGDGSGRMFVVEKAGTIRLVDGGRPSAQPFLDIRSVVRSDGAEQGLLGLVFHPRFTENGRFFVAYTARNSDNTVAEYRVSSDPNQADPASARVLLAIPDFAPNHNGGMLAFGPDGYLYIGTGDGGGGGDPQGNGQNPNALLAKLLRIDVNSGDPYGIPADNPYAGRRDARQEVWAIGLRNPWRFSFDRATGDLWIADVGQNAWEEIDLQPAGSRGGENYGWSVMEGAHCFRPSSGCDTGGLVMPLHEYGHDLGCSVTGGYVYRGGASPQLWGVYLFGDYCSGRIWALSNDGSGAWTRTELLKQNIQISSFGEDEAGEVYMTGLDTGIVYRLVATPR